MDERSMETASPFDAMAPSYDADFTGSVLGRMYRDRVWERLEAVFGQGRHILELGCGTGEDAVRLARQGCRVTGLDASAAMIDMARSKIEREGVEDCVALHHHDVRRLAALRAPCGGAGAAPPVYQGALADFGVVNCVPDLPDLARDLFDCLEPGAPVLLIVMGPCVPWEWFWHLVRGHWRQAFRRFRRGGVPWRGITVRYPSIRATAAAFSPRFHVNRVSALGALLPPSYAESWARRHPGLLRRLERWERRWSTSPWAVRMADHYLMELERAP